MQEKTYWTELSLTCCNGVPTSALFRAAGLFTSHLGWFVWRGENIPIEAARQRALDSLGLRPAEPRSGSFEVRRHAGARQTARESCLMKLTARFLCPTNTVHGLQEIMLSRWVLSVCLWVDTFWEYNNETTIQDNNFTHSATDSLHFRVPT